MKAQIAFYKGPPKISDPIHYVGHYGIRLWTWSKWSHAELVIDGVCYSASGRDGGVRSKVIDLTTGRWDVLDIDISQEEISNALAWFTMHDEDGYDYRNILRFVFAPVGHDRDRWECFESISTALGLAGGHKLTANDLHEWALSVAPKKQQKVVAETDF